MVNRKELQLELTLLQPPTTTHIHIGTGLDYTSFAKDSHRLAVITDQTVASLFPHKINCHAQNVVHIQIPSGEAAKDRKTKAYIEDELIHHGCTQDTLLVVIGGGAALDVGAFTASTFCRGIRLILMPTTLLAMVDAAIGGKNGINAASIKNCIGTVYHPEYVLMDVDFLKSLSTFDLQCGMVEALKHALLSGQDAVDKLFWQREHDAFIDMIYDSVCFKCDIVQKSMQHPEVRHLLNFGHTFAHAIEFLEGPHCTHGVAVARGIIAECAIAEHRGLLPKKSFEAIFTAVCQLQLPLKNCASFPMNRWQQAFSADKKTVGGVPRCVLLTDIGKICMDGIVHPVTQQELEFGIQRISTCFAS